MSRAKVRYIVLAVVGMSALVGAASVVTPQLASQPIMLPFAVGMWCGILWAIKTVIGDYRAIDAPPTKDDA